MEVKIEKMDYEGRGLSRVNHMVTFFPCALPGEEVEFEILKKEKHFQVAKVTKILKKSDQRVPSFCPFSDRCGGCVYDIVNYEDSLIYKKEMVSELFLKENMALPPISIVPSRPVLGYRNKISLKVVNGEFGYYEEESHSFVPIQNCELVDVTIQELLKDFVLFAFQNGNFSIRVNQQKEIYLEINTKEAFKVNEELVMRHKIKGISLNGKVVYGIPYLEEENSFAKYQIPINSFFQVNPYISNVILQDVLSFLGKDDTVLDLYCGCGYFSFPMALKVKKVIGVEVNPNAIVSAQKMVPKNHVTNISFHLGKVEQILPKLSLQDVSKILLDPPRSGLDKSVISWLLNAKPSMIFYLSCNPKTLVRDLKLLEKQYQLFFVKCYDMFSYTKHVEVFTILTKK